MCTELHARSDHLRSSAETKPFSIDNIIAFFLALLFLLEMIQQFDQDGIHRVALKMYK